MSDIAINILDVTKYYGKTIALENLSLAIKDNEFFTLLGPSGCGKTTLLRCIAGFENITSGNIELFNESLTGLPPNKRPVNTVFQQYALFPHMSVTENVMFGLKRLGKSDKEASDRASHVLSLVQLDSLASRMPGQLSGGQQQRVALARALAPNPKVLLLDEPLSALDLKLRQEVRYELQQLQHETGITFVFVTHDQEEAMTMSDRIAVMSDGKIQQIGAPKDIYEFPENRFVADFIGETNLLDVNVISIQNGRADGVLTNGVTVHCTAAHDAKTGSGHISIRPERLRLCESGTGKIKGIVHRHTYLGTDMLVTILSDEKVQLTARIQNASSHSAPVIGTAVDANFDDSAVRLLSD